MTRIRRIKLRLLEENPYCYFCGILVKDYGNFYSNRVREYPLDMATVEHLKTRHQRKINPEPNIPKVLSCYKCNHKRGLEANRSVQLKINPPERPLGYT